MLSLALAALSGLVWGVGDFAGGKAAQTAPALTVTLTSKINCLPFLAVYLVVLYVPVVPASLPWGAAGGFCGVLGLVVFYRAMAAGAMTVVAPVAAVVSALLPVIVGLASGERPGAVRLFGVGCALAAIVLVTLVPAPPGSTRRITPQLIGLAVLAGLGFGLFFLCLDRAGSQGAPGLWPILAAQLTGIAAVGLLVLLLRPVGGRPRGRALAWTLVAGPFDMTANALYLEATRWGDLSLVAPLAALYPVSTVILALLVDRERLRGLQILGLGLALAALVLVSR
ncbi:MAG TPA: EamA family transporter [Microlunatus sp.]|nr:EamA family transporter [Microlunatus sp.]